MGALDTAVALGQGAVRRHLLLRRRAHGRGGRASCASSARRCSSTSRRTTCSTAGSRTALLDVLDREGVGCIGFTALAQGLLTDKYLDGVPADSRAARYGTFGDERADRGQPRAPARAGRHRAGARADARPDGAGLGAARPADDLAGHRREQRRAARAERRRARPPRLHRPTSSSASTRSPSRAASTCGRAPARATSAAGVDPLGGDVVQRRALLDRAVPGRADGRARRRTRTASSVAECVRPSQVCASPTVRWGKPAGTRERVGVAVPAGAHQVVVDLRDAGVVASSVSR